MAGILPYSEGREGRIYYLKLKDGVILSDFRPSEVNCRPTSEYRSRKVESRSSISKSGRSELQLLVPIECCDIRNFETITLTSRELMSLLSGSGCSKVEGYGLDIRLLALLKSGFHLC